jgi:DNA replication protein DnaD
MMVNHEDGKAYFRDSVYEVKRGERITSELQLAERWGWSRNKVRKFLDDLKKEQMLEVKKDKRKTVLKVVNYNTYQVSKTLKSTTESTRDETTERQQKDINNNDNNIYTAITIIEDELQKTGNINPVAPVDADSAKQDETDKTTEFLNNIYADVENEGPLEKIENHYKKIIGRPVIGSNDLQEILQAYEKYKDPDFIISCMNQATENNKQRYGRITITSFRYFKKVIDDEWQKRQLRKKANNIVPIKGGDAVGSDRQGNSREDKKNIKFDKTKFLYNGGS